jgi:putative copper export protein
VTLIATVARLLLYIGAAICTGHALLVAQRQAAERLSLGGGRTVLAVGLAALLLGAVGTLWGQQLAMELPWREVPAFVQVSAWGMQWLQLTAVACILAVVGWWQDRRRVRAMRRSPSSAWRASHGSGGAVWVALLLVMLLAWTMSGLGHSNADERWPWLARGLDALHVFNVGAWIGALCLVWVVARADDRALWRQLSGIATVAAPMVLLSGAGSALRMLGTVPWQETVGSRYGQLLAVKVLLALLIVAIGSTQRRRVQRGEVPVRSAVRRELLLAAAVLIVTAVLTGTEPPG